MVGVVGSSPIAPTNKHYLIKHLAETLGAFLFGYEKCMKNTRATDSFLVLLFKPLKSANSR